MVKVIKKNKKIVAFKASKIQRSVMAAARDAKVYPKERKALARLVSRYVTSKIKGRKVVSYKTLRTLALKRLGQSSRDAAASWRKYDRRHK
jgi:transcriptional regulator NrdR family protein